MESVIELAVVGYLNEQEGNSPKLNLEIDLDTAKGFIEYTKTETAGRLTINPTESGIFTITATLEDGESSKKLTMTVLVRPTTEPISPFQVPTETIVPGDVNIVTNPEPTVPADTCVEGDGTECVVLGDTTINVDVSGLSEDLKNVNEIFTSDSVMDLTNEERQ